MAVLGSREGASKQAVNGQEAAGRTGGLEQVSEVKTVFEKALRLP